MMRVLITGAVEGLGRALCDACLARGDFVVALDNNKPGLHSLTQAHVRQCEGHHLDLSDIAAVRRFLENDVTVPFDLVILNAGISAAGPFETIEAATYQKLIAINATSPLLIASGLLRANALAKGGKMVFISSLSHDVGYPGAAVYAATKDAVAAYARSIEKPLRKAGQGVLTVFPGPLRTEHARRYAPDNSREHKRMDPKDAARMILKAANGNQTKLYPGLGAKLAGFAGRHAPSLMTSLMRKSIYEKLT